MSEKAIDLGVQCEMPRYRCHKEVWALKLQSVGPVRGDGTAKLYPVDIRYAPFEVASEYVQRHQPKAGGYYVVYEDGYASFSPAAAFEKGYTRME